MKNNNLKLLNKYDVIIYDLDNTLINENNYLFSIFYAISNLHSNLNNKDKYNFIVNSFLKNGRKDLYNKYCEKYNLNLNCISEFLMLHRTFKKNKKINLFKNARKILFQNKHKLQFIITNGNAVQQENKWNQIYFKGVDKLISEIYFSNMYEPKPSAKVYEILIKKYNLINKKIIMIGDSYIDFQFASNCKIDFLKVIKYKNNIILNKKINEF